MKHCFKKTKTGLLITPCPKENGQEKLFRVVYVIDVPGSGRLDAAKAAHRIMHDPDSMLPVLHVISHRGTVETIDLSRKRIAKNSKCKKENGL